MYLTRRNDFYDLFNEMFRAYDVISTGSRIMKTNIKETEDGYALDMELPGFAKEDIKAELNDGYLTVTATKKSEKDESKDRYIRKECFEGTARRSFYVGDWLHEDDIRAGFENGVLSLRIPKEPAVKEVPKLITIA